MPKRIKLDLNDLNVKSFTTGEKVLGGATGSGSSNTGGGPHCQSVRTCNFEVCALTIPINGCD